MGKNASSYQIFCINSSVFSTTNDIYQTDSGNTSNLTYESDNETNEHSRIWVLKNLCKWNEEKKVNDREKPVSVMIKNVANFDHEIS